METSNALPCLIHFPPEYFFCPESGIRERERVCVCILHFWIYIHRYSSIPDLEVLKITQEQFFRSRNYCGFCEESLCLKNFHHSFSDLEGSPKFYMSEPFQSFPLQFITICVHMLSVCYSNHYDRHAGHWLIAYYLSVGIELISLGSRNAAFCLVN